MNTRARLNLGELLERGFIVGSLLLLSRCLHSRPPDGFEPDVMHGNPLTQGLLAMVYLGAGTLLLPQWKTAVDRVARSKLNWLLIGLAFCSVAWSTTPDVTLRRSVALLGTSLFALYLTIRFTIDEQLTLLSHSLGIAALLSFLAGVALPQYGVTVDESGVFWRGVFEEKNTLGRLMALATIVLSVRIAAGRRNPTIWLGLGLALGLLLLTRSKTAMVVVVLTLSLFALYECLRRYYGRTLLWLWVAVLPLGLAAIAFTMNREAVFRLLGKDATLTGRTAIWAGAVQMLGQRPWFGYGYGGFWLRWQGPSAAVLRTLDEVPSHAHNGILNLGLELGLVGVAVFLVGAGFYFGRAVRQIPQCHAVTALWPLVCLTFFLLYNIDESAVLWQNNIMWVLYMTAVLNIVGCAAAYRPKAGSAGAQIAVYASTN